MDTTTITAPAVTLPEIPAEILETIPTAPKRMSVPPSERQPTHIGKARATVTPRAWVMGGAVD
jgi:hypothetical protein